MIVSPQSFLTIINNYIKYCPNLIRYRAVFLYQIIFLESFAEIKFYPNEAAKTLNSMIITSLALYVFSGRKNDNAIYS
jgi:hypothetical protein